MYLQTRPIVLECAGLSFNWTCASLGLLHVNSTAHVIFECHQSSVSPDFPFAILRVWSIIPDTLTVAVNATEFNSSFYLIIFEGVFVKQFVRIISEVTVRFVPMTLPCFVRTTNATLTIGNRGMQRDRRNPTIAICFLATVVSG